MAAEALTADALMASDAVRRFLRRNSRTARALLTMDARHFMDGARMVAENLAGLEPAPTRFEARMVTCC